MIRRVDDRLLWSSYPSAYDVEEVVREGVKLIVNLVDYSPGDAEYYKVARSLNVGVLAYPIEDFGFRPPEDVHFHVLNHVLRVVQGGGLVLVHCEGGIGRSGTVVAMYLMLRHGLGVEQALSRVKSLGGGPESDIQLLALEWYGRALSLLGSSGLDTVLGIGYNYDFGGGVDHASTVANIACDIASQLGFDKKMLAELYIAGLLHDIGRAVASDDKHHVKSAEIVMELKDAVGRYGDPEAIAFLVRNHRTETDPRRDPLANKLGQDYILLASILRLADAFTDIYNEEGYLGVELRDRRIAIKASRADATRVETKAQILKGLGYNIELEPI